MSGKGLGYLVPTQRNFQLVESCGKLLGRSRVKPPSVQDHVTNESAINYYDWNS